MIIYAYIFMKFVNKCYIISVSFMLIMLLRYLICLTITILLFYLDSLKLMFHSLVEFRQFVLSVVVLSCYTRLRQLSWLITLDGPLSQLPQYLYISALWFMIVFIYMAWIKKQFTNNYYGVVCDNRKVG